MNGRRRPAGSILGWAALLLAGAAAVSAGPGAPGPGALFTTTPDGGAVNENHYASRLEVYVDGGPVPTGLTDGDWGA